MEYDMMPEIYGKGPDELFSYVPIGENEQQPDATLRDITYEAWTEGLYNGLNDVNFKQTDKTVWDMLSEEQMEQDMTPSSCLKDMNSHRRRKAFLSGLELYGDMEFDFGLLIKAEKRRHFMDKLLTDADFEEKVKAGYFLNEKRDSYDGNLQWNAEDVKNLLSKPCTPLVRTVDEITGIPEPDDDLRKRTLDNTGCIDGYYGNADLQDPAIKNRNPEFSHQDAHDILENYGKYLPSFPFGAKEVKPAEIKDAAEGMNEK